MIPLGFSGGSQDRLIVLTVAAIRWTMGTAEGAKKGKTKKKGNSALVIIFYVMYFFQTLCPLCVHKKNNTVFAVGLVKSFDRWLVCITILHYCSNSASECLGRERGYLILLWQENHTGKWEIRFWYMPFPLPYTNCRQAWGQARIQTFYFSFD